MGDVAARNGWRLNYYRYVTNCYFSLSLNKIDDWTIQLGITRRNSHTYYGQKVKVQRLIPHPLYNVDIMHDNDIALIQVIQSV